MSWATCWDRMHLRIMESFDNGQRLQYIQYSKALEKYIEVEEVDDFLNSVDDKKHNKMEKCSDTQQKNLSFKSCTKGFYEAKNGLVDIYRW